MADDRKITGDWVEIAEKGEGGRHVFMRDGPDVPPSRAGRRHLHLRAKGFGLAAAPGPTDKSEIAGSGGWARHGETLQIRVPGWEGEYDIEEARDDQLILRRR